MRMVTLTFLTLMTAPAFNAKADDAYPDPHCTPPALAIPSRAEDAGNHPDPVARSMYNYQTKKYDAQAEAFNACMRAYIDGANAAVRAIQDRSNAQIKD